MKIGDAVMFVETEKYPAFFGAIGIISHCSKAGPAGEIDTDRHHVRVCWIEPVKWFDRFSKFSDFPAKYFQAASPEVE